MTTSNPIVIPLDGMTEQSALKLAERLADQVWGFKTNDLLVECGVDIVTKLKRYGKVFADPKFHDIPNTVKNGVRRLTEAGADLISLHASGGIEMMEAAVGERRDNELLAISVLTSLDEENTHLIYGDPIKAKVLQFARDAQTAGVGGLVSSPQELRIKGLPSLFKVTPGIRPKWYSKGDDQKRVGSPAQAMADGANLLVIGRPITEDESPESAVERTLAETRQ